MALGAISAGAAQTPPTPAGEGGAPAPAASAPGPGGATGPTGAGGGAAAPATAQAATSVPSVEPAAPADVRRTPAESPHAAWYEKIRMRGYAQVRYNRLFASNDRLVNVQGDRSIGKGGGVFFRRARLILQGDVHERVAVYLQTDAASAIDDVAHAVTMRDWYADLAFDAKKESRLRVGQSKVPYGFENMQSSQNRLPIDRSDPINTGAPNERDLGVFFYWAPAEIRARFKHLVEAGLKGSGDYGVVALGVYNGQGPNAKERNDNRHVIARATYPFQIGAQYLEVGAGGYAGKFVVTKSDGVGGAADQRDVRAHATFVLYPQPFGLQAEYNVGVGPELDAARGVVREGRPHGGYAMAMYRAGPLMPYVRAQTYDGGKKHETDAVKYKVREVEAGVEWRANDYVELTTAWAWASRTAPKAPYEVESGRLLRLQLQFNY